MAKFLTGTDRGLGGLRVDEAAGPISTGADALLGSITTNTSDGSDGTHAGISAGGTGWSTSGSGTGAVFTVIVAGNTVTSITATTAGSGFAIGDTITFSTSSPIGGTTAVVVTLQGGDTTIDDVYGVTHISVSEGTLTDNGGGHVTITTGGGGGGGGMTSWTVAGASGSSSVSNGETVTITGSGGITTAESGRTVTVSPNGILEDLNTLGAASSDGEFIVATGAGVFAYESGATARTSLGLGTMATQDSNAVSITGGTIEPTTLMARIIPTAASAGVDPSQSGSIFAIDTGGGDITLGLPVPVVGLQFVFFRLTSGNTITLDANAIGGCLINGATTYTVSATQYKAVTVFTDGANYYAIG